jgi:hypothetical protein
MVRRTYKKKENNNLRNIYGLARKAAFRSNNSRKNRRVSEGDVLSVKPAAR